MFGRKKKTELKIKGSIRKLNLMDNDLLIVTFPGRLTRDDSQRICDAIITYTGHKHVVVIDSGADVSVLARGEFDYGVNVNGVTVSDEHESFFVGSQNV